jgi:uncharacterized protein (DUF934 family)
MRIILNRQVVDDAWHHVGDDEALPQGGVIVSWNRFFADPEALLRHEGGLGVRVHGSHDVRELAPFVDRLTLIALEFPKFGDGRNYSHARILREELGFRGQLRAVGDVLRDQLFFMARCGINAFELRADRDPEAALSAFSDFSQVYQGASDDPRPRYRRAV